MQRSVRDINGLPLNPVSREYPRNYIRTGISAIDGLTTLIRGQKLPIFSGNGLPHDQLAAQIVKQASLGDRFGRGVCGCIWRYGRQSTTWQNFSAVPLRRAVYPIMYVMFLNLANDPVVERLITPKVALTAGRISGF